MSNSDHPYPATSQQTAPMPVEVKGSNGLATAGFILGLIGLLGSWIPVLNFLGMFLGLLGVVLGGVGLAKSKKAHAGKGLAIAGVVMGALAIVFAIIINAAFVSAVDDAVDEVTDTTIDTPADSSSGDKGEAAAKDLGTSRDNPAPLGTKVTGGDWTVRVNSVKQIDKDSFGSRAATGFVLLQVNMTATYNGDDEQGESAWSNIKFASPDGTTVDSSDGSTLFIAENGFDSLKTVYKGASVKGDQILEVPEKDWRSGVLVVSPDLLSDDTFIALK